jgi:hypothetical protein
MPLVTASPSGPSSSIVALAAIFAMGSPFKNGSKAWLA